MIDGILPVDKQQGWTSHDVVARVRRLAGQRQVGHAGTLDPLATGLLLLVLGQATRFSDMLMGTPKSYRAEIVLGVTTVTDDAEAPIQEQCDASMVSQADIDRVLQGFVGEIEQVPPAYAAIKQGGKKLYQLARLGHEVQAAPRPVRIDDIVVESWNTPRLRLVINCGPGTYIRSIARDTGAALGVGGYLHALRRIGSGAFHVSDAHTLAEIERVGVPATILSADRALSTWQAVVVQPEEAARLCHGLSFAVPQKTDRTVRVYGADGVLLALARVVDGVAHPFRVMKAGTNAGTR